MPKSNYIPVKIYTQRTGSKKQATPPRDIMLLYNQNNIVLKQKNGRKSKLGFYSHPDSRSTQDITLMGIESTITPEQYLISASIHIPSYFEETPQSYTGTFLVDINAEWTKTSKSKRSTKGTKGSLQFNSFKDPICKGFGSYDCPQRLILGDDKTGISHFKFNGQVFFPLLTRSFVVIYYVADESSKEYNWDFAQKNKESANYGSGFVAVNGPIQFEPALGIFITRNAIRLPEIKVRK